MENFYARSVFFVKDAEESLAFYTKTAGFGLDWNNQYEGRAWVFQVSLFGFELILNQAYGPTQNRAGHGRAFIGLDDDQARPLLRHILRDPDQNELFFWIPDSEWANLPPDLPTIHT